MGRVRTSEATVLSAVIDLLQEIKCQLLEEKAARSTYRLLVTFTFSANSRLTFELFVEFVVHQQVKGTVHPKIKNAYFSFYIQWHLSVQIVSEISAAEIFASNIMGVNGALNVVLSPKNTFENSTVMTLLHKIIHRPCCEQLHVGTTFLPT